MSNYEWGDLIFTGINTALTIGTIVFHNLAKKDKSEIEKTSEEIKKTSKEIKKYRDNIINNRELSSLSIVLEELQGINKKLDSIRYNEQQGDTRGFDIFKAYFEENQKILEIKSKIPSKYSKLEEELDKAKEILSTHMDTKETLSKTGKYSDISIILNDIIKKLKKNIEDLSLK